MKSTSHAIVFLVATLLATAVGCSDGKARVTGVVTLDGELVGKVGDVRAYVSFTPASGAGAPVTGSIDDSGEFQLSAGATNGIAPGDYLAAARVVRVIPGTPETGGYSSSELLSAKRFSNPRTSGLRYTVDAGSNRLEIAVTSGDAE